MQLFLFYLFMFAFFFLQALDLTAPLSFVAGEGCAELHGGEHNFCRAFLTAPRCYWLFLVMWSPASGSTSQSYEQRDSQMEGCDFAIWIVELSCIHTTYDSDCEDQQKKIVEELHKSESCNLTFGACGWCVISSYRKCWTQKCEYLCYMVFDQT